MAEWFMLVKRTIEKYGIVPEDICNVDEAAFAMGQMQHYSIKESHRYQAITDHLFPSGNACQSIKSSDRAFVKLSVKENGDLLKASRELQKRNPNLEREWAREGTF